MDSDFFLFLSKNFLVTSSLPVVNLLRPGWGETKNWLLNGLLPTQSWCFEESIAPEISIKRILNPKQERIGVNIVDMPSTGSKRTKRVIATKLERQLWTRHWSIRSLCLTDTLPSIDQMKSSLRYLIGLSTMNNFLFCVKGKYQNSLWMTNCRPVSFVGQSPWKPAWRSLQKPLLSLKTEPWKKTSILWSSRQDTHFLFPFSKNLLKASVQRRYSYISGSFLQT